MSAKELNSGMQTKSRAARTGLGTGIGIRGFAALQPEHRGNQAQFLDWLTDAHTIAAQDQKLDYTETRKRVEKILARYGCDASRIGHRASMLPDFMHRDWEAMRLFNLLKDPRGAGTAERTRFYAEEVAKAFERFFPESASPPETLIHVTCTGYTSPSGAQSLIEKRGWNQTTAVLHAYHMGCYAAIPALRIGAGLLHSPLARQTISERRVEVVHTELCSLHMAPNTEDPEQIVVQGLFGDGLIKYSLERLDAAEATSVQREPQSGFEVVALREEIVPGTSSAMVWEVGDFGIRIQLAGSVPKLIAQAIAGFVERLFDEAGFDPEKELAESFVALHPGGPKIIDFAQEALALRDEQLVHTRRVLFEHGNMSSATTPHIWKALVEDPNVPEGALIASIAFGPGLTICGTLLRKRRW